MSDYERNKVLRYPLQEKDYNRYELTSDNIEEIEDKFKSLFDHRNSSRYFELDCCYGTSQRYLDYNIYHSYGDESGDFGQSRELYDSEKEKYLPIFQQIIPDIDMNLVKLIDYCWYNCTESPDYYSENSFYEEV